jgi:hypothetical protein
MKVESKKKFTKGFVLKEDDLRRIVGIVREQFSKLPSTPKSSESFRVQLKNGAILDISSLDDVLSLENGGSNRIVRLSYAQFTGLKDEGIRVRIDFIRDHSDDEGEATSMRFQVNGEDRDWVLVTSSQLEERCDRLSRFAIRQIFGKKYLEFCILFTPLILVLIMFGNFAWPSVSRRDRLPSKVLETAVQAGKVKEPVEALLIVEKAREQQTLSESASFRSSVIFACLITVSMISLFSFRSFSPISHFCWGDYLEEFQRKESRRQFWLVVIVVGVVVSVVGGIIANNVGLLKRLLGQ